MNEVIEIQRWPREAEGAFARSPFGIEQILDDEEETPVTAEVWQCLSPDSSLTLPDDAHVCMPVSTRSRHRLVACSSPTVSTPMGPIIRASAVCVCV